MASVKQLQTRHESLRAKIVRRQEELTNLKAQEKELKTQLAEAKKAAKEKGKGGK